MQNNYDNVAFVYDRLSRFIFGKAQVRVQTALLSHLQAGDRILIAGGGTGWILDEITNIHPSGLDIFYVESSAGMVELSKKRKTGFNTVHYLQQEVEEVMLNPDFDVLLTGFFFDNFGQTKAEKIFYHLDSVLKPGSRWLFADFSYHAGHSPFWQKALLKTMYLFFRLVCKIEASDLADMTPIFKKACYIPVFETRAYDQFMVGLVYEKPK